MSPVGETFRSYCR